MRWQTTVVPRERPLPRSLFSVARWTTVVIPEVNQMSADDDDDGLCACDRIMMMVKLDSSL